MYYCWRNAVSFPYPGGSDIQAAIPALLRSSRLQKCRNHFLPFPENRQLRKTKIVHKTEHADEFWEDSPPSTVCTAKFAFSTKTARALIQIVVWMGARSVIAKIF
jgi:hypothetical protein